MVSYPQLPQAIDMHALTCIDLLTSYVIAVPIPNKAAESVVEAYLSGILSRTDASIVCHSDNGSELKEKSDEHCSNTIRYKTYVFKSLQTIRQLLH